jgi:hypothetical protein
MIRDKPPQDTTHGVTVIKKADISRACRGTGRWQNVERFSLAYCLSSGFWLSRSRIMRFRRKKPIGHPHHEISPQKISRWDTHCQLALASSGSWRMLPILSRTILTTLPRLWLILLTAINLSNPRTSLFHPNSAISHWRNSSDSEIGNTLSWVYWNH